MQIMPLGQEEYLSEDGAHIDSRLNMTLTYFEGAPKHTEAKVKLLAYVTGPEDRGT